MIQIAIHASSSITQAGLESLLQTVPEFEVVATAYPTPISQLLEEYAPDVLLVEGFALNTETIQQLAENLTESSQTALVVLAPIPQRNVVLQAIALGVSALLPPSASLTELVAAIQAAALGLFVLHPEFSAAIRGASGSLLLPDGNPESLEQDERLTPREMEILGLLSRGLGNRAIAAQLQISEHTVKFHISTILSKLDATSRTEAVAIGLRRGLIML
jgi:two-component system, NarL family, response regulator YdfI